MYFHMIGVTLLSPQFLTKLLRRLPITLYIQNYITTSGCSKPPWGLLIPLEFRSIYTAKYVHWAQPRDSRNLVASLVQAANKTARYYATVRASELGPLFTRA
jgi:hypothetical protein